jgi:hypothetical protein
MSTWKLLVTDSRRRQLRHYRNKVVAHSSERDPAIGAPQINDLLRFASGMTDVWARLARGAGVVSLDLASQVDACDASAKAFWEPWYSSPRSRYARPSHGRP